MSRPKKVPCPICGKRTRGVDNHVDAVHNPEGRNDCPLCGHDLNDHIDITEIVAKCIHCSCDLNGN